MECLRRLFSHRRPDGHLYQQNPTVLYVHFFTYCRLSYHYLHGAGFLEKYEEIYEGYEKKSLVLFIVNGQLEFLAA